MTQLDLLTYPLTAGWKSRDTSQAAAVAVEPKAKVIRERVLAIFRDGQKLTADEMALVLDMHWKRVRPRCSELAKRKLIRDSKLRRQNEDGNDCIVWEAV